METKKIQILNKIQLFHKLSAQNLYQHRQVNLYHLPQN